MHSTRRLIPAVFVIATLLSFAITPVTKGDEPKDAAQAVQGKWVRYQATPNGRIKIVKEHQGPRTILTAFDDQGKVLYAHESEFKTAASGKVRIFTFFNRAITAGPHAGQKLKETTSFIYRVVENRFIEVHGVLEGDSNAPLMIIWERAEEDPKDKNPA